MQCRLRVPARTHRPRASKERRPYAQRRPEESVLYQVVARQLETFLARAEQRERPVPRFVVRELRGFLDCGILARGFLRVHCDACGRDRLVAFSCKGRGYAKCWNMRSLEAAARAASRCVGAMTLVRHVLDFA